MCLLIAEILLFGTGLYLLFTAKMPPAIAGKGFSAEGGQVRLVGSILALPLPMVFCAGAVLGIAAPDLLTYASVIEIAIVLVSAIVAIVMIRSIRKPVVESNQPSTPPPPPNIEPK